MHNEFVNMGGEKMSKSLGNIVTVYDLRKRYPARVIRYFLISAHYRNPIQFSEEVMDQLKNGLERIDNAWFNLRHRMTAATEGPADPAVKEQLSSLTAQFEAAMDDDMNTANALSVLFEAVKLVNETVAQPVVTLGTLEALKEWMTTFGGEILGLIELEGKTRWIGRLKL